MKTIRLSPQGQITIPINLRRQLNLKAGVKIVLDVADWLKNKVLILVPLSENISSYSLGLGKEIWHGVDIKNYLKKERRSWDKRYEPI